MSTLTPSASLLPQEPARPEPGDIPDPLTPPAVLERVQGDAPGAPPPVYAHEALLHGFCARLEKWMQDYHASMMRCVEATLKPVQACLRQDSAENEHARYQLADALAKIQEGGLTVVNDPYQATVAVQSPQGCPVEVRISKRTPAELVEGLDALLRWLRDSGYTRERTPPAG